MTCKVASRENEDGSVCCKEFLVDNLVITLIRKEELWKETF